MDRLTQIFEHQALQMSNFRQIQERNGLLLSPTLPAPPLTREGALQLHLGIHWINLELSEALSAPSFAHRVEELADALHFIAEFCIIAGFGPDIVPEGGKDQDRLDRMFSELIANEDTPSYSPGLSISAVIVAALQIAELLKNKPWKQALRTDFDQVRFEWQTRRLLFQFGAAARDSGISAQELYEAYMGKEQENFRRVRDGE